MLARPLDDELGERRHGVGRLVHRRAVPTDRQRGAERQLRVAGRRRDLRHVVTGQQRRALRRHRHEIVEGRQGGIGGCAADGVDVGAAEQRARRCVRVAAGDRADERLDEALGVGLGGGEQPVADGVGLQAGDVAARHRLLAACEHRAVDPGGGERGPRRGEVVVVVVVAEVAAAADHEELGAVERRRPLAHVGRGVDELTGVGAVELVGRRRGLVEHHQHLHVAQHVVHLVGRHRRIGVVRSADGGVHRGKRPRRHGDPAVGKSGVEAVGDAAAVAVERREVVGGEELADAEVGAFAVTGPAGRTCDERALFEHRHLAATHEARFGAQQQRVRPRDEVEGRGERRAGAGRGGRRRRRVATSARRRLRRAPRT